MIEKPKRNDKGQLLPGQSGNPSGRPKDINKISELARGHGSEAIATLADLMRNSPNDRIKTQAAIALLERGFGKPVTPVAVAEDAKLSLTDMIQTIEARRKASAVIQGCASAECE